MKRIIAIVVCLLTAVASAQTVHVVDAAAGPGSNFTTIQAAVDAASEGDILLVRAGGEDQGVLIDGKSLTLQGEKDINGDATSLSNLTIRNLSPSQWSVVRGFRISGTFLPYEIELDANQGSVWLEDLITPTPGHPFFGFVFAGMRIVDCQSVVVSKCVMEATISFSTAVPMEFQNSSVQLFDCSFTGANDNISPEDALVRVTGGSLGVYDSTIAGGAGDPQCMGHGGCGPALPGEIGLHAINTELEIQDSVMVGGVGMPNGAPMLIEGGTLTQLGSNARTFSVDAPVREGTMVNVSAQGEPGDLAWAYYSLQPSPAFRHRLFDVAFMLDDPLNLLFLGTVPASGSLDLSFPAPTLGAGMDGFTLFVQTLFLDDAGQGFVFSEPSGVAHLGLGF